MERVNTLSPHRFPGETEAGAPGVQTVTGRTCVSRAAAQPTTAREDEHPPDSRIALSGDLCMIDHHGTAVLGCRCLAVSATRMCLRVPIGCGVAVGQRYELCERRPGEHSHLPVHAVATLRVTVAQTQNLTDEGPDRIDVAEVVDPVEPRSVPLSAPPALAPWQTDSSLTGKENIDG